MKKTHILETDLKTLNGESLLGSGDIVVKCCCIKRYDRRRICYKISRNN